MMCHVAIDQQSPIETLINHLCEYNSIALDHQIQAATSGRFQSLPESWIAWASKKDHRWRDIMSVYNSNQDQVEDNDMPPDLCRFIQDSASVALPRTQFFVPESNAPAQVHGVSPKKLHEVFTMSSYIVSLLSNATIKPMIVDIGAGQGYLSRALSSDPGNFHVLALDSNDDQTAGSMARKDWTSTSTETSSTLDSGSITQKTVFIGDTASLNSAIEEWVLKDLPQSGHLPIPIFLVGLHCCGDLTPSILRFVQQSLCTLNNHFEIVGCTIVGCCYNMCRPTSFPLSRFGASEVSRLGPLSLETQHLHLATQSPLTWDLKQPDGSLVSSSAALAVRKVTYRSLLARRLPALCRPEGDAALGPDVDWRQNRVGRLRASAYKDFTTYLRIARGKLGLELNSPIIHGGTDLGEAEEVYDLSSDLSTEELMLSRTLEVLYVLRCLLGPVIESLIAMDRYLFLQEAVEAHESPGDTTPADYTARNGALEVGEASGNNAVKLVNLFDQSTGSLRNLALVWVK